MRDRRLGQAERLGELADAGLAVPMRGDHGHQAQPGRIGQRLELVRQVGGLAGRERLAQQRREASLPAVDNWKLGAIPGTQCRDTHLTSMQQALTSVYL